MAAQGMKVQPGDHRGCDHYCGAQFDEESPEGAGSGNDQTKKGNQWYFGMKAHLGVDSRTKTDPFGGGHCGQYA